MPSLDGFGPPKRGAPKIAGITLTLAGALQQTLEFSLRTVPSSNYFDVAQT